MKQLPKFIEGLVKDGKLKNSIDRDIKVDWPWTKIAGPCSVEGGPGDKFNIVDTSNRFYLYSILDIQYTGYTEYLIYQIY